MGTCYRGVHNYGHCPSLPCPAAGICIQQKLCALVEDPTFGAISCKMCQTCNRHKVHGGLLAMRGPALPRFKARDCSNFKQAVESAWLAAQQHGLQSNPQCFLYVQFLTK
ncbi:hypothetical protein ABBQ32_013833 [Trebouxia sp. C0010 RCD-2024]